MHRSQVTARAVALDNWWTWYVRGVPVAKAVRSEQAKAKDASKRADEGLPLHSFRTLLVDLGTLTYDITHTPLNPEAKIRSS